MHPVIDALRAESERVATFLGSLDERDWRRDTRCPPMRLHELVAHTWRGAIRIQEMLEAGPVEQEPEKDAVTYFQYDAAVEAPHIVERAFEVARTALSESIALRWRTEWSKALQSAETQMSADDLVYQTVFGLMKLSEYLRTRVVEVVIHHMDMRDALGLDPDPDESALDVVSGVMAGLLGTDPRVLGMDGVRFALVGTGRAPVSDDVRVILGPLAEQLPVFS